MAASAATASSSPGLCPNYAVICSFLERYGALLDLPELTFPQLERYLQDTSAVPKLLVDLHVKLLRKIGKSVSADRWEKYLVKVCQEFNTTWAWELEEKGYKEMSMESKTGILKYLCESQFDDNVKFKTAINEEDPDKMRLQPIGRDKDGQMYWFQLDQDNNVRVYIEEQDDLDGASWKCIVRDRSELAEVVALLKTQIDPELLKREELKKENKADEDGEKGGAKKLDTSSDEDIKDKPACPVSPKTENSEKENLKPEDSEAKSVNGIVAESKSETELNSESDIAKTLSIKEEPMEVTDTKSSMAPNEPETQSLPVKAEKAEEVKKTSAEVIQQALKNDQQAKIPLKKRGMKFSEDLERNSGSVQTPVCPAPKDVVDQTKKTNDHVNGEIQPEAEKELQDLGETLKDKKQTTEPVAHKFIEEKVKESTGTKDKKEETSAPKEKENADQKKPEAVTEKKEAHESPPPPKEESPPLEVNNVPETSSEHLDSERKQKDGVESEDTAAKVNKADKTLTADESEKLNLNHRAKPKDLESQESGEKPADESETGPAEEKEAKRTENIPETKKTEVSNRDTAKIKESENQKSAAKETSGVIKATAEVKSAGKDPGTRAGEAENAVSASVIKKTETIKEAEETREAAQTSSVIQKAEKPAFSNKAEEKAEVKEQASVIKALDRSCKTNQKQESGKDGDKVPVFASEKPKEAKKTRKNCEDDSTSDASKKNDDSTSEAMEAEPAASELDLKQPEEEKDQAEKEVEQKRTEEEKPSCPTEKVSDFTEEMVKKCDEKKMEEKDEEKKKEEEEEKKAAEEEKPMEVESSETKTDAEKTKEKESDDGKLLKDGEKPSESKDKETKQDSETDKPSKANEEEEEEEEEKKQAQKEEEKPTEPGSQKTNKEAGVESPAETETSGKEATAEPLTVEERKSKEEEEGDEESATKKEVANGDEETAIVKALGFRRRRKRPAHRRKAELQVEERPGDSESDSNMGRSLRRSPRISRPTPKAVEINDRKLEKSQAAPEKDEDEKAGKEKEEEEVEEEEEVVVKKKPREKKADQEGQPKPKGRKRRKVRWSNTRTRRKKKCSEDEDEESEEESSEDDETEEEEEDDSDEDYKVERSRKRRSRNRERRSSDSSTSTDDDLPPNDDPCKHCGLPNHPELILLCDSCDNGYHTACLRPPLMIIPDGEWFCPPCQHKQLCDKLEEQLLNLDAALKKRERAERRKERLIYVGISLENIITPSAEVEEEKPEIVIKEKKEVKRSKSWGRRSTRTKKNISYRFDEFDEAIEEAIEEDIKEAEGGGAGRGKDMANITGHRGKDMSTILQSDENKENGRPPRPSAAQRKKKRRRLNDLDSDSTVDEEESEEEFRLSESSEDEFIVSGNESEPESEADDSDLGSNGSRKQRSSSSRRWKQAKQRRSSRKRRRPRGYSDDEEEETDEEEEDEIVTEGSSEYSDSDLDMSRRRSRRSQKKTVNYCESSGDSDGSQAETNRAKVKARRRQETSESEASFSRDSEEESRDPRVRRRGRDSSEEDLRQRRRRMVLKRRRASEDDDSDDSSDDSSEEDRPVRKRVNRIDSDDDEEEEEEEARGGPEEKPKEKKAEEESKGTNVPSDCSAPANGQGAAKNAAPGDLPKTAIAPNGLEMAPPPPQQQEDDEDDLLGVTDLVDYVCNNEQL